MYEEDPEKVLEKMKSIIMERIPRRFRLNSISDVQVLSPMNKGLVGVSNLNAQLQEWLNPQGQELSRGGRTFRHGDKVMQIKNNHDKKVFNGDVAQENILQDMRCQSPAKLCRGFLKEGA